MAFGDFDFGEGRGGLHAPGMDGEFLRIDFGVPGLGDVAFFDPPLFDVAFSGSSFPESPKLNAFRFPFFEALDFVEPAVDPLALEFMSATAFLAVGWVGLLHGLFLAGLRVAESFTPTMTLGSSFLSASQLLLAWPLSSPQPPIPGSLSPLLLSHPLACSVPLLSLFPQPSSLF